MDSSRLTPDVASHGDIADADINYRRTANGLRKSWFLHIRTRHVSWDDLEPLWISGLAMLFILLGNSLLRDVLHVNGKNGDWALYLALGTLFPATAIGLLAVPRWFTFAVGFTRIVRLLLAIFLIAVAVVLLGTAHRDYLLFLVMTHLIISAIQRRHEGGAVTPRFLALSAVIIVLSWFGATRLIWWAPYDTWILGSNYAFIVFVAALLLVVTNLSPSSSRMGDAVVLSRSYTEAMRSLAGVLLIGMASIRTTPSMAQLEAAYHHWGVFVGPAALVRQGGWLLWDVPSQYGFLSILSVAALPTKSVWESFYIVDSLLLFCSACFIFFLLRSCRRGAANFWFSLVVSIASVFLVAGWTPSFLGPNVYPSIGAVRFVWCYVLLLVLLWEVLRGRTPPHWSILIVGCVVWVVGSLWSAESAVYCAAIWLPAYALIVVRATFRDSCTRVSRRRKIVLLMSWLGFPVLLLALAIGGISAYYLARLGNIPDWRLYGAFVSAYSTGGLSRPLHLGGAGCGLFIVFCALSTLAAALLRRGPWHAALPLVMGSWGALWAVSSYYIGRSEEPNVTNLSPLICTAIATILFVMARYRLPSMWDNLIRLSLVPVIVVQLTLPFGNLAGMRDYLTASQVGYQGNIDQQLPVLDKDLLALFQKAHVQPTDPIVFFDTTNYLLLPAWPIKDGNSTRLISTPKSWLPVTPMVPFVALSPERSKAIVSRFTERTHLSGWLVQSKTVPYITLPWFAEQLATTHVATEKAEVGAWQIIWFQYKGTPNDGSHTVWHSPPPPDIVLDGKMQATLSGPIAAIYGDGWYDYEVSPNGSGRWAHSPATVLINSADARDVRLAMTLINFLPDGAGGISNRGTLLITTDSGASAQVPTQIGQPLSIPLHLHPGQNMVSLALTAGNFTPHDIDPHSDMRSLSFSIAGINITT